MTTIIYSLDPGPPANIPGGTPQAQVFIPLHEVAHYTDAIAPDIKDPNNTIHKMNDTALEKKCKKTIKAAKQ